MSTSYGFLCRSHVPPLHSPSCIRESTARELLSRRAEFATISAWDDALLVRFENSSSDISTAFYWLRQHPDCDVVLVDEYGKVDSAP